MNKFIIFTLLMIFAGPVFATLGGTVDSIASDSQVLGGKSMRTMSHAQFTVHEFTYGGTRVREYANASGIVFAIAWDGLSHPDLSALLGTYYADYKTQMRARPSRIKGARFSQIRAHHLVVERGGHMRNLRGRAYDETLFPSGVAVRDIR